MGSSNNRLAEIIRQLEERLGRRTSLSSTPAAASQHRPAASRSASLTRPPTLEKDNAALSSRLLQREGLTTLHPPVTKSAWPPSRREEQGMASAAATTTSSRSSSRSSLSIFPVATSVGPPHRPLSRPGSSEQRSSLQPAEELLLMPPPPLPPPARRRQRVPPQQQPQPHSSSNESAAASSSTNRARDRGNRTKKSIRIGPKSETANTKICFNKDVPFLYQQLEQHSPDTSSREVQRGSILIGVKEIDRNKISLELEIQL